MEKLAISSAFPVGLILFGGDMIVQRIERLALALAVVCSGLASPSLHAQPAAPGNTFADVCPLPSDPTLARCLSQIRVDTSGVAVSFSGPRPLLNGAPPYGPSDLRSAYNIFSQGSASMTVAIVDAYGYPNAEADLATYRAHVGLPPCTTANGCFAKYDQRGGTPTLTAPTYDEGWALETALDIDMVSAICPNCHIMLVEADSNSFADLDAAVNQAVTLGAKVISNSYGAGEFNASSTTQNAYSHAGVAIFASSGWSINT